MGALNVMGKEYTDKYNMNDKMLNLINIFSFFILTNSHKFLYQIIHKYSFKVTYSNITI